MLSGGPYHAPTPLGQPKVIWRRQLEAAGAPHRTPLYPPDWGGGLMMDDCRMTQVLTISCKLKVSLSQATKLDATLDAFVRALNWVNQNTPEKGVSKGLDGVPHYG